MKILIIGFAKIQYMPYLRFYLESIDPKNEIHVVYWNRDLQEEDLSKYSSIVFHEFAVYQEDNILPFFKIKNFVKFRNHVKKILQKNEFDFVICLHTFSAVLISDKLIQYYHKRYIFDYRDYTYEKFFLFKKLIGKIVIHSQVTFVSSEAFRKVLPKNCSKKIYTSHNFMLKDVKYRQKDKSLRSSEETIRIGYWGFIRDEQLNREIIRKFAADKRFELHYYGREQQIALRLKAYARSLQATNVFFHGAYEPEARYEIVKRTDLLHNLFDDTNMMSAVSNKFYDGHVFYIPQLCMKGSFMERQVTDYGTGFSCDPYKDCFTEEVYHYYHQLDYASFVESCDALIERVSCEYKKGHHIIENATSGVKNV